MLEKLPPGCLHSYGQILKRLEVAGFILTESAYAAKSILPKHSHEYSYFCFVLQGVYTEFYGSREIACKPSTLTFRPSGGIHEDQFHNQDGRVFVIEISPAWLEKLRQNSLQLSDKIDYRNGFLKQLAARLNREFHQKDNASLLAIEGLTVEIMAEASRRSNNAKEGRLPVWLKQARELLHERFSEHLTLEQIATEVGIHPVHLATVFRQKYHCTIGEYIRRLRIEYACREILKGQNTFANIALDAGFANQSHFSKSFKRQIGCTPAEYKKSHPAPNSRRKT